MSVDHSAFGAIYDLYYDGGLTESELLSQLEAVLKMLPNLVNESDKNGSTILHRAASRGYLELCKLLIEIDPELVMKVDNRGALPFHGCCFNVKVKTAKYLYQLYPEIIGIPLGGHPPLHLALYKCGYKNLIDAVELIRFVLQHDQGAIHTGNQFGVIPLHLCFFSRTIAELVFNSYPEAIHRMDNHGNTPIHFARNQGKTDIVAFFENQIELERQAREDMTPDDNGQLPIHRALQNEDMLVGAIKLMLAAYPPSISMADNQGRTLVHIACIAGNLDAVKYLMKTNEESLKTIDTEGNLPLHLACLEGKCDIVPCILEQSTYGVTLHNADKQTPVELLLFEADCDRDCLEFVEAVRYLFQVNPADTLKCLANKEQTITNAIE